MSAGPALVAAPFVTAAVATAATVRRSNTMDAATRRRELLRGFATQLGITAILLVFAALLRSKARTVASTLHLTCWTRARRIYKTCCRRGVAEEHNVFICFF